MKRMIFLLWLLSLGIANLSCGDEGEILVGIQDGEKLSEGALVPFILEQNYPNPFNPSTAIRFAIYQSMHVRLKVFTDDWQEVETLIDRVLTIPTEINGEPVVPPAFYSVEFRARDLASGEYYYTMEALGIIEIRKMKLIK
jgi:hypothetical protein